MKKEQTVSFSTAYYFLPVSLIFSYCRPALPMQWKTQCLTASEFYPIHFFPLERLPLLLRFLFRNPIGAPWYSLLGSLLNSGSLSFRQGRYRFIYDHVSFNRVVWMRKEVPGERIGQLRCWGGSSSVRGISCAPTLLEKHSPSHCSWNDYSTNTFLLVRVWLILPKTIVVFLEKVFWNLS